MNSSFPTQGPPLSFTRKSTVQAPYTPTALTHHHPNPLYITRGFSAHLGEVSSSLHAPTNPTSSASQPWSQRGEQLEFSWALGDPFGEDVWAFVKSRLGTLKDAHEFAQRIAWSWGTWRRYRRGRRTETPGMQVSGPNEEGEAGGQGTQDRRSSWSWRWLVLPHGKALIKEPYLNVCYYLHTWFSVPKIHYLEKSDSYISWQQIVFIWKHLKTSAEKFSAHWSSGFLAGSL